MSPDIESLLSQLTLQEKAALTVGMNAWQTVPVERLGIPSLIMSDGPHGLRRVPTMGAPTSLPATCFPTASATAASWNTELAHAVGAAIAGECLAQGVDIILGPGNNMKRTPLCGRNFEYFSEDPFLGGELASAYINGVQSRGVGTSLKHFAANNQEYQRHTISAEVDERSLREIYLSGFERAVKSAKPWTVMCSYNRLGGVHASQNQFLLSDILKDEWGFEGFVVSDWGAVHDRSAALAAGLDLEMPGPQSRRVERVVKDVQAGRLPESVLDEAVRRILRIIFQAQAAPKGGEMDAEAHHALARQVAGEAIVLLKNDHDLLPFQNLSSLAVIGRAAKEPRFQGGGSSQVNPLRVDIPFDEIIRLAGDAQVTYASGCDEAGVYTPTAIEAAAQLAGQAQAAVLFAALPVEEDSEGLDRPGLCLSDGQEALIQAVCAAQPDTVVVLNNGSALDMRAWMESPAAILEAWLSGQAMGGAVADVLFGQVNPSGRLAETFPLRLEDTPAYINYPGENGQVRYGEGLFTGYRYYDARHQTVAFPFGFGLSYTTFRLDDLQLSSERISAGEGVSVTVQVTNTGERAGKEVVQVYVHDRQSRLPRPDKELKGFAKLFLAPGESCPVTITLDERAFAYYDPALGGWTVEPGEFDLVVGASAAGPFLQAALTIQGAETALPLSVDSTLMDWFKHPQGGLLVGELLQNLLAQPSEDSGASAISAEMALSAASQTTLETALAFLGRPLPAPPEVMVQDLLKRIQSAP